MSEEIKKLQVEEMRKLQGTWKQIAYEKDGVKEPLDEQGWESPGRPLRATRSS